MADAKDAGLAIGKALKTLRDRIDEVDAKEPTFEVPTPSVTVEGPEIDLSPIRDAVSVLAEQMAADAKAQQEATLAMGEAILALTSAVTNQEIKVEAISMDLDGVAHSVIKALTAPKVLTFDENGEPIGVEVAATRVN